MNRNPILILLAVLASLFVTSNAHAVYHVQTGRFPQKDPNGSGQVLLDDLVFHGRPFAPMAMAPEIQRMYRDGANLYQYCGSNPVMNSDPLGLEFSLGGLAVVQGVQGWLDASGTLEDARQGLVTFFGLAQMIEGYSFWQEYDADWATDWSQPDDGYSGAATFAQSWDQDYDSGPVMAGIRGPGSMSRAISRAARISRLAKPPMHSIQRGIQEAQKRVGSLRRGPNNDLPHNGPTWRSEDGLRGYRLEPPHHGKGWHIDWYDWSGGKRGAGGLSGTIPID